MSSGMKPASLAEVLLTLVTGEGIHSKDIDVEIKDVDHGKIFISPTLGKPPDCYDEAVKWIQKKKQEEAQVVNFSSEIDVYPSDGAYALYEVLKKKYGWVEQGSDHSGRFSKPPSMVEVQTDVNDFKQVPWGAMEVPGVNATFNMGGFQDSGLWKFRVHGKTMKMHLPIVNEIIAATKEYLRQNSIYRGKNVRLLWKRQVSFFGDQSGFDFPVFLPSTLLTPSDLILPESIYAEVRAGLFSLITNAAKARSMGVPTKRLTILAGEFGTGKTMTAAIVGELCREVNRTFIYLNDVKYLAEAIRFSQQYAPALIFAEDIDTVTEDEDIDKLSNTVDGVDTKNLDVIVVLTTNHLETIPKKFLRPGRSDLIIEFMPPDAKAAGRLVLKYAGNTLDPAFTDADALTLGQDLAGLIPASIREVVERAKLFAISDNRSKINDRDISLASKGVRRQCELLKEKRPDALPEGWSEVGIMIANRPTERYGLLDLPAMSSNHAVAGSKQS